MFAMGGGCIRKSHRDLDSHRDKSCSSLSSTQECFSQHQDSQGHSCSLYRVPARENGNAREMPAVGYTGPRANTEMTELPESENLIHLIGQNLILAIKFTFINAEGRQTCM